ncbi:2TM domain-containing protein [Flavobacterium sp. KACC 22761]|uniref:2TM domain-containing protein n=1 Tax=Flavobacterium sp. KACC 22761 TaxID=3092665 RepID=UPI002A75F0CB|nr:2TM domain-containing protein [Flavobacterium sp. KACC 22761]WPO78885.1 2TM domain-containing protein [Flavobacterium sp. KACC 22761]
MKTKFNIETKTSKNSKLGFKIHLLAFLLATPIVFIIWYLTDTTYPWPLWSTASWAIGIIFHYLGVFVFKNNNLKYYRHGNI